MAGAGVKLFVSGEVAYAAEVNQYLMDQSIMRFANRAARASAFGDGYPTTQTNPSTGLPGTGKPALAIGMFSYLLDNSAGSDGTGIGEAQFYDGTQWVGASNFAVIDGSITEVKLADDAVTSAKIADNAVTSAHIAPGTVIAADISDNTITEAKLTTSVAGSGLSGGNGTALAVNVDDSTIEINSDALRLKDSGITSAKLATSVAGSGLSGGNGTALAVNVDDSTIEINSDTLRLKDSGITSAKLGSGLSLTDPTLTGTTKVEEILEAVSISGTAPASTEQFDVKDGAVHFHNVNTANAFNVNIRGDSSTTLNSMMAIGQSLTIALLVRCNNTAHFPGTITIDTTGMITGGVRWFGNVAPSASTVSSGSVMVYSFTIIKTAANTYTVLGSESRFG